eukprot:scaffold31769_cov69-Phaeocystis_antarctica.AAC.3
MPEAVVQLLSFFEASTLCKDECNFEGPAVFPSEATTLNRPLAAEYSPWRAPHRLANRLANVPPFPHHIGAQPQHRRNWAAIAMFRRRHIRAAAGRYNALTVGDCCGDYRRLCVAFLLPFGGNR